MRWRRPPAQRQALAARREALAARREALRAELARRKEALRQQRKPEARERRRWPLLLLMLLLLLLLLRDCRCQRTAPEHLPGPGVGAAAPAEAPPAALPPAGRVRKQPRPSLRVDAPPALPWLADFHLQVAARSPRLAACFVDAQRPGALRWTCSVDPAHGEVSEHSLEPTLAGDTLSQRQRECVLEVLSEPAYALGAVGARATPSRVGLVIEF